jgi:hypothetical protein
MLRLRTTIVTLLLGTAVVLGGLPVLAAPEAGHANHGRWTVALSTQTAKKSILYGVSAISSTDMWAVGGIYGVGGLAEHWNGTRWARVAAPRAQQLGAVAAISPTDVWATGGRADGCSELALVEHWNGRRWATTVIGGALGPGVGGFSSISAVSSSDIWVAGEFSPDGSVCDGGLSRGPQPRTRPLVAHWDGHAWRVMEAKPVGLGSSFISVTALSPDNVWAAGNESIKGNGSRTLIDHWNGRNWSVVASPHPGARGRGFLRGITAVGPSDLWAVGYYAASRTRQHTLIEHWNGSSWRVVASPNLGCHLNDFASVSMVDRTDGWAVGGGDYCGHPSEISETAHWNGVTWKLVPSQNVSAYGTNLAGVTVIRHRTAWAVGAVQTHGYGDYRGLIERYRP